MSSTSLVIPTAKSELPTCIPNLMPFHINYSGPALVSSFMPIDKLTDTQVIRQQDERSRDGEKDEAQKTEKNSTGDDMAIKVDASAPSTSVASTSVRTQEDSEGQKEEDTTFNTLTRETTLVDKSQASLTSEGTHVSPSASASILIPTLDDADKRFVSAFRGRTIHGLTIDIPAGYGGLVLQSEDEINSSNLTDDGSSNKGKGRATASASAQANVNANKKTNTRAKSKSRGRLTRSAVSKSVVIDVDDDDAAPDVLAQDQEMAAPDSEADAGSQILPEDRLLRKLVPKAQFSSFTLWHADRPVEKNNDEYYRTLTEWISLSHEIHRTDL